MPARPSRKVIAHDAGASHPQPLAATHGQAITNFDARLPAPHSALAHETLKDPICSTFSVWAMTPTSARSRTPWCGTSHVPAGVGSGFAFVGVNFGWRSRAMSFSSTCFLPYAPEVLCGGRAESHGLQARTCRAIELLPDCGGQAGKSTDDKPTIGLLLCKTKKRTVAEYALSGIEQTDWRGRIRTGACAT